jgi:hypothetical protein
MERNRPDKRHMSPHGSIEKEDRMKGWAGSRTFDGIVLSGIVAAYLA